MAKYKMQLKNQDGTMQDLDLDAKSLDGKDSTYYLNYNNFNNTPTIPTKLSELENDTGFITKRQPIPSTGPFSEFYVDTSKSVEQVVNILNNLTTYIENQYFGTVYVLSEGKDVWNWLVVLKNNNTYEIRYIDDDVEISLFTQESGWNLDAIIDGKFTLPKVANEVKEGFGLENDKLIDLMWVGGEGATNDSLSEEDVLEIIENNSETTSPMEFSTMEIGTSENYDTESDNQVATTKTVQTIVNLALGDVEALLEAI